jgi:hypothetical protein
MASKTKFQCSQEPNTEKWVKQIQLTCFHPVTYNINFIYLFLSHLTTLSAGLPTAECELRDALTSKGNAFRSQSSSSKYRIIKE